MAFSHISQFTTRSQSRQYPPPLPPPPHLNCATSQCCPNQSVTMWQRPVCDVSHSECDGNCDTWKGGNQVPFTAGSVTKHNDTAGDWKMLLMLLQWFSPIQSHTALHSWHGQVDVVKKIWKYRKIESYFFKLVRENSFRDIKNLYERVSIKYTSINYFIIWV